MKLGIENCKYGLNSFNSSWREGSTYSNVKRIGFLDMPAQFFNMILDILLQGKEFGLVNIKEQVAAKEM